MQAACVDDKMYTRWLGNFKLNAWVTIRLYNMLHTIINFYKFEENFFINEDEFVSSVTVVL